MQPEGSLLHSEVPTTCPYPEPARSSPYPHIPFLKIHLNIILLSTPGFPSGLFPSRFPTKTLYTPLLCPIRATCPAHLIPIDFITRTLFGEQYRSLSSSFCIFCQLGLNFYKSLGVPSPLCILQLIRQIHIEWQSKHNYVYVIYNIKLNSVYWGRQNSRFGNKNISASGRKVSFVGRPRTPERMQGFFVVHRSQENTSLNGLTKSWHATTIFVTPNKHIYA